MTAVNRFKDFSTGFLFGTLTGFSAGRCTMPCYTSPFIPFTSTFTPTFTPYYNYTSYFSPSYSPGYNPFLAAAACIWDSPAYNMPKYEFKYDANESSNTSSGWLSNISSAFNFSNWSLPKFTMPKFEYSYTYTPPSSNTSSSNKSSSNTSGVGDTFTRSSSYEINNNTVKNISWWKAQDYNEEKGKKLAECAIRHSNSLESRGVTDKCGRGVRESVNIAFYGGAEHHKAQGLDAKDFGNKYFVHDTNFKKINVEGLHLSKNDIPAGAIVIYEHYSGNPSGHIEVSDGNGHGYSDLKTTLLQNHCKRREPKEIWIPV